MWLVGQSEETKKAVSDYFSTPSVIEYNFQNYGAEITLEKLFLDLLNEPLKAFQSFLEPADKTPNILDMGSAKVVAALMADKMTDTAKNVNISQDGFDFDIPDIYIFEKGTSKPNKKFVEVLERLTQITSGLQESEIKVTSALFTQAVPSQNAADAKKVAQERLDLIINKLKSSFEHNNNNLQGLTNVKEKAGEVDPEKLIGFIRVSIHQKPETDGKKRRKLEAFGKKDASKNVYDNFAKQLSELHRKSPIQDNPDLINPVDNEIRRVESESDPMFQNKE